MALLTPPLALLANPLSGSLTLPPPQEITVTNYTGEAREYLKRLIQVMGAKFTPSMSGKNTVVVAAL